MLRQIVGCGPNNSRRVWSQLLVRRFSDERSQEAQMGDAIIRVDSEDTIMGPISKRDAHNWSALDKGEGLHRAFSVFLFDKKGRLLLQRRSAEKITFPNLWANSCCSHPRFIPSQMESKPEGTLAEKVSGSQIGAIDRAEYELGIPVGSIEPTALRFGGRYLYKAQMDDRWGEYEMDYALFCNEFDGPINPRESEVRDIAWVSNTELREWFTRAPEEFTPWFQLFIQKDALYTAWEALLAKKDIPEDTQIHNWM